MVTAANRRLPPPPSQPGCLLPLLPGTIPAVDHAPVPGDLVQGTLFGPAAADRGVPSEIPAETAQDASGPAPADLAPNAAAQPEIVLELAEAEDVPDDVVDADAVDDEDVRPELVYVPDEVDELPDVAYILGPDSGLDDERIRSTIVVTSAPSSVDLVSAPRRSLRGWLAARTAAVAVVVGAAALVSTAGVAFATFDYKRDHNERIFPGTEIAGVDVGGMRRSEAIAAVDAALAPELRRELRIRWKNRTWKVTPEDLGATSNAAEVVDAALEASDDVSWLKAAGMRVLGAGLGFSRDVDIKLSRAGARGFVQGVAASFDREPTDATMDYTSGWVELIPEQVGRTVDIRRSTRLLYDALRDGDHVSPLAVDVVAPETTTSDFDQVLLLHIGANRLFLYQDGRITHDWVVATGTASYPTPTGLYEVTEKRYLPTWVNPAPDGWGASMPAMIGPGAGNPLGLRALNWSASGIRFHGTESISSLGTAASHGCVRLSNGDVIELYDLVDVGTPIVSIVSYETEPPGRA